MTSGQLFGGMAAFMLIAVVVITFIRDYHIYKLEIAKIEQLKLNQKIMERTKQ